MTLCIGVYILCLYRIYTIAAAEDASRQTQNGRGSLDILISNASALPIYEQIAQQIKDAILSGTLEEGTLLPGIRSLANDLHVSVITTKRAYADLEEAGFVESVQGKGTFVTGGNLEMLREERLRSLEGQVAAVIAEAKAAAVSKQELHEMLDLLMDD